MRGAQRATAVLVGAALLAACAQSTSAPVVGGPTFEGEGVRFTAPVGWFVAPSGATVAGAGHWLVYLATQPLHVGCDADPPGPCPPLVDDLAAGGLFIGWATANCAGPACALPDGEVTRVGGREAVIVVPQIACGGISATEEMDYLVAVSPQRIDSIVVCGREITAGMRSTLRAFLDRVVWRTP